MASRPRWYWHQGNSARLLIDGPRYFPAMLEAIEGARRRVFLEFYFVSSGRLMDRFIRALQRAVEREVLVCLLVDAIGARGLSAGDRRRLLAAGVQLQVYNPIRLSQWARNFSRDHRKLLVVDDQTAFIGGSGLADEFLFGRGGQPPWHEFMLQVQGPVLTDWSRLFLQQWRHCSGQALQPLPWRAGPSGDSLPGRADMKVSTTEGVRQQEIKANFRIQINAAHSRVWLLTAYFLPSLSIRRALANAARRGVDVRLLLPGPRIDHPGVYHAARRYYKRLLTAGVRIYEYQPQFIHAKLGVCDDWVSIGSCNLDHWNLRRNLEANQEVVDAELTAQVYQAISTDFDRSLEITLEYWLQRPWHQRAWGFILGYLNSLILRMV